MSRFTEYLKLIPKAIPNADKIISGWLTDIRMEYGELPDDQVKEIITRRAICETCPLMNINTLKDQTEYKKLYNEEYKTERADKHCTICGCPVQKKTSSLLSKCGLDSYNQENLNNQQTLKWTTYNEETTN